MGNAAKIFNTVLKIVQDNAGEGKALSYLEPNHIFAAATAQAGISTPYVVVRLPDQPYRNEVWGATQNVKLGVFIVEIVAVDEVAPDEDFPYGGDGEGDEGILKLVDDICDLIDNQRAYLLSENPKVYDLATSVMSHTRITAEALEVVGIVRIEFKVRFQAGSR